MSIASSGPTAPDLNLDQWGILTGTDKSSLNHDYLRHYEHILSGWRDKEFVLLEIGVLGGASLKAWQRALPRVHIVGADINPRCQAYAGERISIEIGSQDDPQFLETLVEKYHPAVVVDDGSHRANHVIKTFEVLFPLLPAGGIFIIEDLYLHFGATEATYRASSRTSLPDYLGYLSKSLMAGSPSNDADAPVSPALFGMIDSIGYFRRAAVLTKKASATLDLAEAERLVAQSGIANNWFYLATKYGERGDFRKSLELAQAGVRADPDNWLGQERLRRIAMRARQFEIALDAARKVHEVGPQRSKEAAARTVRWLERLVEAERKRTS